MGNIPTNVLLSVSSQDAILFLSVWFNHKKTVLGPALEIETQSHLENRTINLIAIIFRRDILYVYVASYRSMSNITSQVKTTRS